MNKHDITLIVAIIIISFITLFILNSKENKASIAKVYYDGKEVLAIELSNKKQQKYEVTGKKGIVFIETVDNKIRVIDENSKYHICSKQGYISKSYETIVCLPNKILIKIENNDSQIDTVVK